MSKIFIRLLLVPLAPLTLLGLLEGLFFLTKAFEPLSVIRQVKHHGKMFWTSEPKYARFVLRRENAPPATHLWLPVERVPGQLRVVMLGESAAAGFPLEEYNLGRITRVLWDERFPDRPMEMANLTMTGINSHVLRIFAREAMQMDPDVVVFYLGHNEAVGPYGPISRFSGALPSEKLAQLSLWVRNTRTGRFLELGLEGVARLFGHKGQASWTGLEEYSHARMAADDPALDRMMRQTRANLRAMIRIALDHGCKVLVCVPAVNLTDWPPLASADGYDPSVSARAAYVQAQDLQTQGRLAKAWPLYRRACDLDLLRLRADSRLRQMQRELVQEFATPDVALIDADFWLHEWNPVFRSDEDFFLEHVHLTFQGRVAVASLIVDGLAELTGQAPPMGVGRGDFADFDSWWRALPERSKYARSALLFTEFDEGHMWGLTDKLFSMNIFSGLADRDRRRAEAKRRCESQLVAARTRLNEQGIRSAYTTASKLNSDEWIDHSAAQLWSFAGQGREFWRALEAAHRKYPFFRLAHYEMASRAILEKQYEEALGHIQALEELRSTDDVVPMLYGELYWAWGKPEQAIPFLERNASNNPKDYVAWFNLGMARQMAGMPADAAVAFRRALSADPKNITLRGALAKNLLDQKKLTEAERKEALGLARAMNGQDPDNLDTRLLLVIALLANGFTEEAQSQATALEFRVAQEKGADGAAFLRKALSKAREKFSELP